MSRAVSLDASMEAVTDLCAKQAIAISVIEPLQSGGTRVVFNNAIDAQKFRVSMKTKLIDGPTVRSPLYACRTLTPYS